MTKHKKRPRDVSNIPLTESQIEFWKNVERRKTRELEKEGLRKEFQTFLKETQKRSMKP